jgi:hypothetical protein
VAGGECPNCGHIWRLHPGVAVGVKVCAECIYEEDIGQRDAEDMCRKTPPEKAEQVARRLLALLREEAQPLLAEGRASVHATTVGEFYNVTHSESDEAICGLRPTREGALPVSLRPEGIGFYLFPGDGPSVEFWEGTEADYEQARSFVNAVIAGQYRYSYEERLQKPLIFRWRPSTTIWVCVGRFLVDGVEVTVEHWNAPPKPGEALEVQAMPY